MNKNNLFPNHIKIAVIGEFNSGKSSLLNSILTIDILPTDVFQTTATINMVTYGPKQSITIFFRDGTSKTSDTQDISSFNAEKGPFDNIDYIIVETPKLAKDLLFVDTPGFNDPDLNRDRKFLEILPLCDVVLFVISADQPMKASEVPFLKSIYTYKLFERTFFVLNHSDTLKEPTKVKEQKEYVSSVLKSLYGDKIEFKERLYAICSDQNKIKEVPVPLREVLEADFSRLIESLSRLKLIKNSIIKEREIRSNLLQENERLELITNSLQQVSLKKKNQMDGFAGIINILERQLRNLDSFQEKSLLYREAVSALISQKRDSLIGGIKGKISNVGALSNTYLIDIQIKQSLNSCFEETIDEFVQLTGSFLERSLSDRGDIKINLENRSISFEGFQDIQKVQMESNLNISDKFARAEVGGLIGGVILSAVLGPPGFLLGQIAARSWITMASTNRDKSSLSSTVESSVNSLLGEVNRIFADFVKKLSLKEEELIKQTNEELIRGILKRQWELIAFQDIEESACKPEYIAELESEKKSIEAKILHYIENLKKVRI